MTVAPILYVGVSVPSHRSVAVAAKLTVAVVWPGFVNVVTFAGQVTVGGALLANS